MAQMVERILGKDEVISSILISSSKSGKSRRRSGGFLTIIAGMMEWQT